MSIEKNVLISKWKNDFGFMYVELNWRKCKILHIQLGFCMPNYKKTIDETPDI